MPKLIHEGVALAYEEAGSGAPPLVFVPGWSSDRTAFTPQLEHFSRNEDELVVVLRKAAVQPPAASR